MSHYSFCCLPSRKLRRRRVRRSPRPRRSRRSDQTIRLDVTRVPVLFTVADKKGHFVTDLTKDEFEVIENKKLQTILDFNGESDLPLRLAVLIDTSNSIRERFTVSAGSGYRTSSRPWCVRSWTKRWWSASILPRSWLRT